MDKTAEIPLAKDIQWYGVYATTSAELKLLLLRLTGRGPGRCEDFEGGMTIALAPAFIQETGLLDRVFGSSASAELCFLASVGSREGVGEGGGWGTRRADGAPGPCAVTAVLRAVIPAANRGILFGGGAAARLALAAAAAACRCCVVAMADRSTRVGRCSDVVPRAPESRVVVLARGRATGGATPRVGRVSSISASSSSE
jgi:hypothetical protein